MRGSDEKNTSISSPKTKQNQKMQASASLDCFNHIVWSSRSQQCCILFYNATFPTFIAALIHLSNVTPCSFFKDMWLLGSWQV